jgi:hypothetical protein
MPSEFPPAGTKCVDCGCCLATIYAGGDPVCWECDEGIPCKGKQTSLPAATLQKVEEAAELAEKKSKNASLAVARLLRPRNYPKNRKRAEKPMANLNKPSIERQGEIVHFASAGTADSSPGAPDRTNQSLKLKYGAVIQDLVERREEIDRIITVLRAFEAKA